MARAGGYLSLSDIRLDRVQADASGTWSLWLLAGIWAFTFVEQGPIHPPLLISAIIVAFAWRTAFMAGHSPDHLCQLFCGDQPVYLAVCSRDMGRHAGVRRRAAGRSTRQ